MLDITELWFKRAVPQPTERNKSVQFGVMLEEMAEVLTEVTADDPATALKFSNAFQALNDLAKHLKGGAPYIVKNRELFLDGLGDVIVTAVGTGYMHGMNVPLALERINTSNFSKFKDDGFPIFDENGKIAKNKATYKEPDLNGCY